MLVKYYVTLSIALTGANTVSIPSIYKTTSLSQEQVKLT